MTAAVRYFLADADGRIVASGRCRLAALQDQARPGLTAHLGEPQQATQYLDRTTGQLAPRQAWDAPATLTLRATGTDMARIPGVPPGAQCLLRGPTGVQMWTERDGWVELTSNVAGSYTLTIDPPRHLAATVRIEALP